MKVLEFRNIGASEELKQEWNALLSRSASNTIFLTWEWMQAWWAAYAGPAELRVLAAYDASGALCGIAPLQQRQANQYGQMVRTLSFVGDGSNDSDYQDLVIAAGCEEEVIEAFLNYWAEDLKRGCVLQWNEIPETSPNLNILRGAAERRGLLFRQTDVACGAVRLPDTWEDYLLSLRPRFRTKIRSVLRHLEARPEVQFGFCTSLGELEPMLPALYDLHTRRWVQDGMPGVFNWKEKRKFYATLSDLLLEKDRLRMSWLKWNGRALACQYGFAYQQTYFHLQEGYEPASEHLNVGMALRAWSIQRFLEQGIREYDFLGGIGRHKTDWGAAPKRSFRLVIALPTHRNYVFCHGPEWDATVRESVKRLLPESVIRVRRTWKQRHLEPRPRMAGQSGPWLRQGLAECYFRAGMPAITRKIRDRYRLSLPPNGHREAGLRRRKEACGRVLYYHRVNNERDPFFPAISTALFEEEIRFIARHHRVVSLATLLESLEHGDQPESLVTVTFDDGYQDNYHHALPILERYGVPASIFLTTAGLDSREPLWFESLALAVKRAEVESVDVEIDIPRRFWLRTREERLAANAGIFELLRQLPDASRCEWLPEILRRLGLRDCAERRDKMLTWEQVRAMQGRGIDFGAHTVTHPFVSRLSKERAHWEVSESKRRIEEETQREAAFFAYPNGREPDFSSWNEELLRQVGYQAALTTIWGLNYQSTNRMELRRGGPWEENPAVFAYKFDWYQLVDA